MNKFIITLAAAISIGLQAYGESLDGGDDLSIETQAVPAPVTLDEVPSEFASPVPSSSEKKGDLYQAKEATKLLNKKIQIVDSSLDEESQEVRLQRQEVAAELKKVTRLQKELAAKTTKLGKLKSEKKSLVAKASNLRKQRAALNSKTRSVAAESPRKSKNSRRPLL